MLHEHAADAIRSHLLTDVTANVTWVCLSPHEHEPRPCSAFTTRLKP
jgi:hypothetical protein